jgi:2-polyprenyl-3-methyl-5-hydroxy-6-metoxy-1,4-benzoquinol methylase
MGVLVIQEIVMGTANCAICGSKEFFPLLKTKDLTGAVSEELILVRCSRCGLTYLNPMPTEDKMKQYYSEKYFETSSLGDASNNIFRLQMARFLNNLKSSKGKALDVGCGDGNFLLIMKRLGWNVYGVDISESAVRLAKKKLGVANVFVGTLANHRFPSSYFDVISFRHVLEHLQKPADTLLEIRRILKNEGVLGVSVPNIDSLYFRVFKEAWFHLDLPRHLYQFSPKTLTNLLIKTGFRVIKRSASLEDPFELFRDVLLRFRIKSPVIPKFLLPAILVLVLLNLPFSLLISFANRGTSIQFFVTPTQEI